jgi:phospho-N-acetylmuramoyl-pentapeptide-transferase
MLIWLLKHYGPLAAGMEAHTTGDSRVFLTARAALALVTSFAAAVLLGPLAIRWLRRRFRERIDSASRRLNELHSGKRDTPTMGGVFVMAAVVVAVLLWGDLANRYVQIGLYVAVAFAALGAADDWIKLSTQRRGLTARQKFLAQALLALPAAAWLYGVHRAVPFGTDLVWPIGNLTLSLGSGFVAWSVLVLVGSSNGVNLTDGLDGLAGGCVVFAGAAFTGLSYLAGHYTLARYLSIPYLAGCGELSVLLAGLVGAMLGFLWYNCHPAQVFMGDTGSLALGALLGLAALVTRQELLLVVVGGVFVVETLSVMAQVGWFKLTGHRLIACSPLHNHFLFRGLNEHKIVVRFWIGGALLALVGVASLKIP